MGDTHLPPVGQRVWLEVDGTQVHLISVVDDVDRTVVLLREPVDSTGATADVPPAGTRLRLAWTTPGGRHELASTLTGLLRSPVPLWELLPDGGTRTTQLRRFARASDALPACMVRTHSTWPAVVADLGEGGARCVVAVDHDLVEGDDVLLTTVVDDQALDLPAHVLEVAALPDGRSQLRLAFTDIGRAADLVRRHVLAQQRRARAVTR